MKTRLVALVALTGALIAACGGGGPAASSGGPHASSPAPATSSASTNATAWTVTSASKATVTVREQLVGVNLPSDAVLTATGASGSFAIGPDGTFTPDSKITFDLNTLASDQRDRDTFIKRSTLQVQTFPTATFVPTKATGLTLPLPASGSFTFSMSGTMTIHGVSKDVTFDVTANRVGAELTATATANPDLHFGDFGMTAPSVPFRVVSVTDDIRLSVNIVATGPTA